MRHFLHALSPPQRLLRNIERGLFPSSPVSGDGHTKERGCSNAELQHSFQANIGERYAAYNLDIGQLRSLRNNNNEAALNQPKPSRSNEKLNQDQTSPAVDPKYVRAAA